MNSEATNTKYCRSHRRLRETAIAERKRERERARDLRENAIAVRKRERERARDLRDLERFVAWYDQRAADDFLDLCRLYASDPRNAPRPSKAERKRADRGVLIDLIWRNERNEREAIRQAQRKAKEIGTLRARARHRGYVDEVDVDSLDAELQQLILEQAVDDRTAQIKYATGLPAWLTEDYD